MQLLTLEIPSGVHYGEGYHVDSLSTQNAERYAQVSSPITYNAPCYMTAKNSSQTVFAFLFLQTFTVFLIKMSLLFLYWRTFTLKRFRYAVYVVGVIVIANAVETTFAFFFQCQPVEKFWKPKIQGHCVDQKLLITMTSLIYILTDFTIYTMPLPLIWHLQMSMKRRVELSIVFLVGGL